MTNANPRMKKKMASTSFFLAVAILAIYSAGSATATDYIVGDQYGWTTNVDYQAWAKGKQFVVGDRLIFKYKVGVNNVYKVDGTAFKQCTIPPHSAPLTTGNDVIVLATPGRKWYISGVGQYCKLGQKLVITVGAKPEEAPAPSWPRKLFPAPAPAPVSSPPSWPIVVPSVPAQVPSPPWPTVPAPATPYWPWPIVFPPAPAPAPASPYWPWPFPPTGFPFPPTLPIVQPPFEIVPAPEPNHGY